MTELEYAHVELEALFRKRLKIQKNELDNRLLRFVNVGVIRDFYLASVDNSIENKLDQIANLQYVENQ